MELIRPYVDDKLLSHWFIHICTLKARHAPHLFPAAVLWASQHQRTCSNDAMTSWSRDNTETEVRRTGLTFFSSYSMAIRRRCRGSREPLSSLPSLSTASTSCVPRHRSMSSQAKSMHCSTSDRYSFWKRNKIIVSLNEKFFLHISQLFYTNLRRVTCWYQFTCKSHRKFETVSSIPVTSLCLQSPASCQFLGGQ